MSETRRDSPVQYPPTIFGTLSIACPFLTIGLFIWASSRMTPSGSDMGLGLLFFGVSFGLPFVGLLLGFLGHRRNEDRWRVPIAGMALNGLCIAVWVLIIAMAVSAYLAVGGSTRR